MLIREEAVAKIQKIPEPLLQEVIDFMDFVISRYGTYVYPVADDLSPVVMTRMVTEGRAFDWLNNPEEDGIYSDADGEPV
ncbi:MAG: DUF2281 domain-containing protein [Chloroflexi bacterium]|nr:DUF2281 domain-containing protein [Chloroflexota bacterium]MBP8058446.1 DUF2281 domain-containing protein [Chloroflexota bacterium]